MNRFKTKKKTKEEAPQMAPRPSQDSDSFGFRFRKGKKSQEEPKPELDLENALPKTDDFRTSLLMSGLSARFSMLREQDDPSTKIGKASDDSVLQPRRQSRLADLGGFGALGDIAEVESLGPPFARMDYSDADSLHGSIMNRAKPTEGNNLFGGRQKIYKIAVGSASSKNLDGGMGGRALYEDDVPLSSFQKWRLEEKSRRSFDDDDADNSRRPSMDDSEARPDSSSSNYNRKRETSSTVSSVPSLARNSTAATSVTSQQRASSIKDCQSTSTAPASSGPTPGLERSFTRTRRLYETGLNHELHEQQSSALSRIDTLSRQRPFGARTPDLSQNSPSPTTVGFSERSAGERRILAKGSAPNLRSMSPVSRASSGTPDLGIRSTNVPTDPRPTFVGSPPLSPPISEAEEIAGLPIGPNDLGKATALGVFQKPSQPYDETRFAQRQLQLQQGRDTPNQPFRTGSVASFSSNRSRSSSPAPKQQFEGKSVLPAASSPPAKEEVSPPIFSRDEGEPEESPVIPQHSTMGARPLLQRPADSDHPAFRDSALPTPLSVSSKFAAESPNVDAPFLVAPTVYPSPLDSPTLGIPNVSNGLSGMVRRHLRADSAASSIYGTTPVTADFDEGPISLRSSDLVETWHHMAPTESQESEQDSAPLNNEPEPADLDQAAEHVRPKTEDETTNQEPAAFARERPEESDEFASQLADSARKIRERLTTYVESGSRPSSPNPTDRKPLAVHPSVRSNALGLLKAKAGKTTSVVDRSREPGAQPKPLKMLGISESTPSVVQRKASFEIAAGKKVSENNHDTKAAANGVEESKPAAAAEPQHDGIRAFRQARLELQKLRDLEAPQRNPPAQPSPTAAPAERSQRERPASRDRRPQPPNYRQRAPSDGAGSSRTRSSSNASSERSNSRPPVSMRKNSSPGGERSLSAGSSSLGNHSPGNMRQSPIGPSQGYPSGAPTRPSPPIPRSLRSSRSNTQLASPAPMTASGLPTPSGMPLPQRGAPVSMPMVNSDGTEVPGLTEAMKRPVNKRDISEPTFVMSTSRVPTVELPPAAAANRSRSNSSSRSSSKGDAMSAPPLPPINPRRRQDSTRTRTIFGNIGGRNSESSDGVAAEGPRPERQRLQSRIHDDGQPIGPMVRAPSHAASSYNVGPPASRMVVTTHAGGNKPGTVLPGGMI